MVELNNKIQWRIVVELVAAISVVLSLTFVGYEMRLSRSVAQSDAQVQNAELIMGLSEYLSSYADIWTKGCMAEEIMPSEAVIFKRLAHSVLGYHQSRFYRTSTGLIGAPRSLIASRVARSRFDFPGFNAEWESRSHGPQFRMAVDEQYELLVETGAERNNDVATCGSI